MGSSGQRGVNSVERGDPGIAESRRVSGLCATIRQQCAEPGASGTSRDGAIEVFSRRARSRAEQPGVLGIKECQTNTIHESFQVIPIDQ